MVCTLCNSLTVVKVTNCPLNRFKMLYMGVQGDQMPVTLNLATWLAGKVWEGNKFILWVYFWLLMKLK